MATLEQFVHWVAVFPESGCAGFFFGTTDCTTGGVAAVCGGATATGGAGRGRVLYTLSFCRGTAVSGSTQMCFSQMRSPLQSVSLLHPAANADVNGVASRHATSSERQNGMVMARSEIEAKVHSSQLVVAKSEN